MANTINRTQRDSDGRLLWQYSVNTPGVDTDDWLVNPDLSGVVGVEGYYWKVTGTPPDGSVVEMDAGEKTTADATRLSNSQAARIIYLKGRADFVVNLQYRDNRDHLQAMLTDSNRALPNRAKYLKDWAKWLTDISKELDKQIKNVNNADTVSEVNAIELDEAALIAADPHIDVATAAAESDADTFETFVDANAVALDAATGETGILYLMQIFTNRREFYNDTENPVYLPGFQPLLGETGVINEQATRILNLETILGKTGWLRQLITCGAYTRPEDVLIYYGWLNSFNSATNAWDNELVAQDMAKYSILVFGDGVQDPGHGDYANTQIIIPRIRALNPRALIFGYVTADQAQGTFETKAAQWDTLQVHGIFMDEAGYDFGRTRQQFNDKVDYVHGQTYANLCFANAWNPNHVLGTENDTSYPNSTYNPPPDESNLTYNDWVLLESFPVNTDAIAYNDGYEPFWDWASRGNTMVSLRGTYGTNFAGCGIIANGETGAQGMFDFGFISSLMFSLGGYGTSDTSYAASSAAVTMWDRPDTSGMGCIWTTSPSVQEDAGETGIFYRYAGTAKMTLDFAEGGETGIIARW